MGRAGAGKAGHTQIKATLDSLVRQAGRRGAKLGGEAIPSPSSVGKVFGERADESLSPTADWPEADSPGVR